MVPWSERPRIDIDLAAPLQNRFEVFPPEAIANGKALLQGILNELPDMERSFVDRVRRITGDRFHEEIVALAQSIGVDWQDVLLANLCYDVTVRDLSCSTLALPTAEGPVLARNLDWWPEDLLARASYLLFGFTNRELAFANAGWPGMIGAATGLSKHGFAVALNAVSCPDDENGHGYPVLLQIRRVLEDAASFDEAVGMLERERLAAPCLLTVVGQDNEERVLIERSCTRSTLHRGHSGCALVVTNHYRHLYKESSMDPVADDRSSGSRFEALCQLSSARDPTQPIRHGEILWMLTDPGVIQTITAQHVIMRPRECEISLFVPRRLLEPDESGCSNP